MPPAPVRYYLSVVAHRPPFSLYYLGLPGAGVNPPFSPGGEMITQGFESTENFIQPEIHTVIPLLHRILCGFKDQVRACTSAEKCGLEATAITGTFYHADFWHHLTDNRIIITSSVKPYLQLTVVCCKQGAW